VDKLLIETDSGTVTRVLTAYAVRVFAEYKLGGPDFVITGVGMSAADFASEVHIDYVTGGITVRTWSYLFSALRNNIRDKLRSSARKTTDHVPMNPQPDADGNPGRYLDGFPSSAPSIEDRLCEESYKNRIRECVKDKPPLKELVEAVFDLDLRKPQEIAETLGTSVDDINLRKRRLERLLIKSGAQTVTS